MAFILQFRYFITITLAILVNVFFYLHQGIKIVNDSHRYMEYAHQIASGNFYQEHNIWYIAYCGFLALFFKVGLGIKSIVFTQIIVSIVSVFFFQRACENFTQNKLKGLISSLLYLAFFEVTGWNTYILTESLFVSMTCFFLYAFSIFNDKKDFPSLLRTTLILFVVFWLRPMGVALLAAFIVYIYLEFLKNRIHKVTHYCLILCAFVSGILLLNQMLQTFHLVENYETGEIVFGISRIPNYKGHEQILLDVPKNLLVPTEGSTLFKAIKFYVFNPSYALKLSFLKGFYFLSHYKPYYSLAHNLHSFILLLPCYTGLLFYFLRDKFNSIKLFVFSFLLLNTGIIMLTSVDWDGRFLMGLTPIIFCFFLANKQVLKSFFEHEKTL